MHRFPRSLALGFAVCLAIVVSAVVAAESAEVPAKPSGFFHELLKVFTYVFPPMVIGLWVTFVLRRASKAKARREASEQGK